MQGGTTEANLNNGIQEKISGMVDTIKEIDTLFEENVESKKVLAQI